MRRERGLSSAASCSGFSDRENRKKLYIYIQVRGGWRGLLFPHGRNSPPSLRLMSTVIH